MKHAKPRPDRGHIRRTVAAAVVALGLVFGLSSASIAGPAPDSGRQSAADIAEGSLYHYHINDAVEQYYITTQAPHSIYWSHLNNGIVSKEKLAADVTTELAYGTLSAEPTVVPPTVIDKIGGPFASNATLAASVALPAGTWLVTTNYRFDRTVSGAEGTRPQIALRYDGQDAGTAMGVEISETAGRELVGSVSKVVTVTEEKVVQVYLFGYNDDASASGGGELTGSAEISALKTGVVSVG